MCFGCWKELSHWDDSLEYPQHMFRLRNKKINFLLCTLNKRPASNRLPCCQVASGLGANICQPSWRQFSQEQFSQLRCWQGVIHSAVGCSCAVLYAAQLASASHVFKRVCFSFINFSNRAFHHHDCFLHWCMEGTPHTCSIACSVKSNTYPPCSSHKLSSLKRLWIRQEQCRVSTSSGNHGKPWKLLKKIHAWKIMEFEQKLNNHGKILNYVKYFDEIPQ